MRRSETTRRGRSPSQSACSAPIVTCSPIARVSAASDLRAVVAHLRQQPEAKREEDGGEREERDPAPALPARAAARRRRRIAARFALPFALPLYSLRVQVDLTLDPAGLGHGGAESSCGATRWRPILTVNARSDWQNRPFARRAASAAGASRVGGRTRVAGTVRARTDRRRARWRGARRRGSAQAAAAAVAHARPAARHGARPSGAARTSAKCAAR